MTTLQHHTAFCAVCGGKLAATTITHEEKRSIHLYLFQNVPAKVCTACGEIWIDEEVFKAPLIAHPLEGVTC